MSGKPVQHQNHKRFEGQDLPQGRKSRIEIQPGENAVRKIYNENGDPTEKYRREVGFYRQYGNSRLVPKLVDAAPGRHIVTERITAERLADALPLAWDRRAVLVEDYSQKVAELFDTATIVDRKIKQVFYDGQGSKENLAVLKERLEALSALYDGHPIITDLRASVGAIDSDGDLLIKLDWNLENLFTRDGRIYRFIDFEQAFIGTKRILTGILLHNPRWPAARLFNGLKNAGFFEGDFRELRKYLCYGFASVLVDSIQRRGTIWELQRLETAFQRHVDSRYGDCAIYHRNNG